MNYIDPIYIITLAAILSVTLVSVIALTKNTYTDAGIQFNKNTSAHLKTNQTLLKTTKVDCFPALESSQPQNCDTQ